MKTVRKGKWTKEGTDLRLNKALQQQNCVSKTKRQADYFSIGTIIMQKGRERRGNSSRGGINFKSFWSGQSSLWCDAELHNTLLKIRGEGNRDRTKLMRKSKIAGAVWINISLRLGATQAVSRQYTSPFYWLNAIFWRNIILYRHDLNLQIKILADNNFI